MNMPVTITDRDVHSHYETRRPLPLPVWRDLRPEPVAAFAERASNLPGADLIVMPVRSTRRVRSQPSCWVTSARRTNDEERSRSSITTNPTASAARRRRACDEYLRGAPGGCTIRVNPAGVWLPTSAKTAEPATG